MKIFICASKHLYGKIPPIKNALEAMGHVITLPNSYERPMMEEEMKQKGREEHIKWKSEMLRRQIQKVRDNDAVLVINCEKNGQANYIGGATFLEIFCAFEYDKKIYLLNPIPENIFRDELIAINPIILDGDIHNISKF